MAEYLVLRFLPGVDDTIEWVIVDAAGALLRERAEGSPFDTAEAVGDRKVVVLAPGASVLRTTADIPVRGSGKILQAVPFAMEEQLATDVDELHFAIGRRGDTTAVPVAVVERLEMEAWLELLAAANIKPAAIYAESDALAAVPNTTTILIDAETVTVRGADGTIAVTDIDAAAPALDLWLTQVRADDAPGERSGDAPAGLHVPSNVLVYIDAAVHEDARVTGLLDELRHRTPSVEVSVLGDGALPRLATQIVAEPGVNLLQGRYAPRSDLRGYWPAWRLAAALLLCLCAAIVGAKWLEISALNRQAAALDAAIEQAIRYTFPDVGQVRDARALLKSKLRGIGGGATSTDETPFLDTLKVVAAAIAGASGAEARLESINFRSGVMELRVSAPTVEALDRIRRQIDKSGDLRAEIQSANPEGDGVRGRIRVTPPDA